MENSKQSPIVAKATAIGYKSPGVENQDAMAYRVFGSSALIVAVADGVGSLPDSSHFSQAAVRAVVESFTPILTATRNVLPCKEGEVTATTQPEASPPIVDPQSYDAGSISLADNTHMIVKRIIRDRIVEEFSLLDEYNGATTLLYALILDARLYWGMTGDGAIIIMPVDRKGIRVFEMENKDFNYTDVVRAIHIEEFPGCFGVEATEDLEAVVLMTDGIFDTLNDPSSFVDYLCSKLNETTRGGESDTLQRIIDDYPKVHGDDKTIVFINLMEKNPEIEKTEQVPEGTAEKNLNPDFENVDGPKPGP